MSTCALCGAPAPPPYRAPPAETAPDLDLRPGEPTRSTLGRWVMQCRSCGACAPDLSALSPALAPLTQTPAYRAQKSRFSRWATLVQGTPIEAEALLQAAWEADDRAIDVRALRLQAASVWPDPMNAEQTLRLVDVLRRAGAFSEAAALVPGLAASADGTTRQIAAFQQARIEAEDTGRHLMSSALRPPARTPHVTHGRGDTGFWGRLFGGRR